MNNTQIDNSKDIDVVMPMYNSVEYSNNYSESLWQFYRDEPFINDNGAIAYFPADNNNSASFKFKAKIADRIGEDGTKNVKIRVPLKYLSNFWRTFEMPFINCEINLIVTWSARCFIIDNPVTSQEPTFTLTNTKLYVPVVTLSTQDNAKLLEKSSFKKQLIGINMNQK